MSSQGPSSGPNTGYTGITGVSGELKACILEGTPSQVPPGYAFDKLSIRDASDWIKYKKQSIIYKDPKTSKAKDPWFVHGNDFRLEWLNGENKCEKCDANAISGNILNEIVP
jgi:hypothetical protein